jgi:hypothetical protein
MNIERAKKLAAERFGRLDCDTVTTTPVDVDWSEAFTDTDGLDPRAELVYPDFSGEELDIVLGYIDERDSDAADEFKVRLTGLNADDGAELESLKKTRHDHRHNPTALHYTIELRYKELRYKELRAERDETREEEEDVREEIDERASELAQESPEEFEPMMNYAYPLPSGSGFDAGAAQAELMSVGCVVVVMLDDEPHLALSGGGMDLSWEICHAFLVLGFRPPLHFSELPNMAGRGVSDGDLAILGACLESAEIAAKWAGNVVERLSERIGGAA